MKKNLLVLICLFAASCMAHADEVAIIFAGFNYTGNVADKVLFSEGSTTTDINDQVFNVPAIGSFVVKKDIDTAKMCYINPQGQNPHLNWEKNCTMTFTLREGITVTKAVFYGTTKTYTEPLAANPGATAAADKNTLTITWEGSASSKLAFTTDTKKVRIKYIEVTYSSGSTGIDEVSADDNAPVEYYNLQGIRVNNPQNGGLYITRQGTQSKKVLYRE